MCRDRQRIYLAGIGMGGEDSLTVEVKNLLESCDCIIGAKRLTDTFIHCKKPVFTAYQPEEIHSFLKEHGKYREIAVLLSGDAGFYSGAKKLEEELAAYEVKRIPGISSVAYLAARLHTSWEDAALLSAHGRKQNYIHAITHNEKTFLLLGGKSAGELCEKIRYYSLEDVDCWIGRRLSYDDERLIYKKGGELKACDCCELDVALIKNPNPDKRVLRHIRDEEFIRGKVPMTKSEIRAVSLGKLELDENAILYDIGAGSGSVSVEAAVQSGNIKVYAVEKNPQGVRIIRENRQKFRCDWLEITEGTAPGALEALEPPTHVFIGGSSGNLKEILAVVKRKNPCAKIVLNAISLETVKEVMEAVEEGLLREPEIVQVCVSKTKKLGDYHMMAGQNPVFIITEGKG